MAGESSRQSSWMLAGLAPGSLLAGYRLEDRIGAGGMAVVFRARDERLDRTVALKVLTPALAGNDEFRERFIRESRAAAAVDHPHIIPVYAAGEADGVLYIAMRYVAGGDLRSAVYREGGLSAERTALLISSVASALDAAHAAGLVHRDVKPANILLDTSPGRPDHPYLSDFGLSKGAASSMGLTGTGQFLGTPDYSAPEQISGKPVNVRTDQYALACVAFTMLSGKMPFARDEPMAVLWAHTSEPPPSVTALRPDLSHAVDQVLARAMAKAPEERFGGCGEFADSLRAALSVTSHAFPSAAPADSGSTAPSDPQAQGLSTTSRAAGRATVTVHRNRTADPAKRSRGARAGAAVVAVVLAAAVGVAVATLVKPAARPSAAAVGKSAAPSRTGSMSRTTAQPGSTPAGRGYTVTAAGAFADPGSDGVLSAAVSPDGKTLTTADANGTSYVWDIATHSRIATLTDPGSQQMLNAAFSPDGDTLAAAGGSKTYIWNLVTRTLVATLPVSNSASLSDQGTLAVEDAASDGVDLWDVRTSTRITKLTDPDHIFVIPASIVLSPDGRTLAVSDDSGRTYLWDTGTGTSTATLTETGSKAANWSAISADGKTLASADLGGKTYVWNIAARHLVAALSDPTSNDVEVAGLSSDGKLLATIGYTGRIVLWNISTRRVIATVTDPGGKGATSVLFSADGKRLAVGDGNGKAYLWDISASLG